MYGSDFVCSTDSKKRTSICPLDLWRPRDETQFWHVDYLRGQSCFDLWPEIETSNLLTYLLTYLLICFHRFFYLAQNRYHQVINRLSTVLFYEDKFCGFFDKILRIFGEKLFLL